VKRSFVAASVAIVGAVALTVGASTAQPRGPQPPPVRLDDDNPAPARLAEISLAESERMAVAWKEQRPEWRPLQALLR